MKNMGLKIKNFLQKNKRIIFTTIFVLFFLGPLLLGENISFASESKWFDNSGLTSEGKNEIIGIVNFIMMIVSTLAGIAAYLVAAFLSPEWTSGAFFGITSYLKNIWILISNMVYFVFAFLLILIAFMNIVGAGGENYQLKQSLPRFVVGILIVPFSWFIVNFVISLVGVLTMASLSLPFSTFELYNNMMSKVEIPKRCELDLSSMGEIGTSNKDPWYNCSGEKTPVTKLVKSENSTVAMFAMTGLYTYGVIGLENISQIKEDSTYDKIKTIFDLLVKVVFDALFVIIYCILIIALAFVLVVRSIWLWIFMAFSPTFGLLYFFKKNNGGIFDKFNIKQFFGLAFVPVYATLALSFGMLFLIVVGRGISGVGDIGFFGFGTSVSEDDAIIYIGEKKEESVSTLVLKGAASDFKNTTNFLDTLSGNTLGVLGGLIIKIFGLVVLWIAFMAAFKASKITEEVAKPFSDFGDQVGKIISESPKYLPIFGGYSMSSINKSVGTIGNSFESRATDKSKEFLSDTGLDKLFNLDHRFAEMQRDIKKINTGSKEDAEKILIEYLKKSKDNNEVFDNEYYKMLIYEVAKKTDQNGIPDSPEKLKKDNISNILSELAKNNTSTDNELSWFKNPGDVDRALNNIRQNQVNNITLNVNESGKKLLERVGEKDSDGNLNGKLNAFIDGKKLLDALNLKDKDILSIERYKFEEDLIKILEGIYKGSDDSQINTLAGKIADKIEEHTKKDFKD